MTAPQDKAVRMTAEMLSARYAPFTLTETSGMFTLRGPGVSERGMLFENISEARDWMVFAANVRRIALQLPSTISETVFTSGEATP